MSIFPKIIIIVNDDSVGVDWIINETGTKIKFLSKSFFI